MVAPCLGMQQHPVTEAALHQQIKYMNDTKKIRWELRAHLTEILGHSETEAAKEMLRLLAYPNPYAQLLTELAQESEETLTKLPKFHAGEGKAHTSPLEEQIRIVQLLSVCPDNPTLFNPFGISKDILELRNTIENNKRSITLDVLEAVINSQKNHLALMNILLFIVIYLNKPDSPEIITGLFNNQLAHAYGLTNNLDNFIKAAATAGNSKLVSWLLYHHANKITPNGSSMALLLAIDADKNESPEIVAHLLNPLINPYTEAQVNHLDDDREKPNFLEEAMTLAASKDSQEAVELLLNHPQAHQISDKVLHKAYRIASCYDVPRSAPSINNYLSLRNKNGAPTR